MVQGGCRVCKNIDIGEVKDLCEDIIRIKIKYGWKARKTATETFSLLEVFLL